MTQSRQKHKLMGIIITSWWYSSEEINSTAAAVHPVPHIGAPAGSARLCLHEQVSPFTIWVVAWPLLQFLVLESVSPCTMWIGCMFFLIDPSRKHSRLAMDLCTLAPSFTLCSASAMATLCLIWRRAVRCIQLLQSRTNTNCMT